MLRLFALPICLCASPLAAHPHIFIDTTVELVIEDGQLSAVRMEWLYDDLFSLLLAEDMGLDQDADGSLQPAEAAVLSRRVTDWPPGYDGALHVRQGGRDLALGPPQSHRADFVDGRMVEMLTRRIDVPVDFDVPVEVMIYEPEYYSAYDLIAPVSVTGSGAEGCTASIVRPDIYAAQKEVEEMIGRLPEEVSPEEAFPAVGHKFSDRVVVTCAR